MEGSMTGDLIITGEMIATTLAFLGMCGVCVAGVVSGTLTVPEALSEYIIFGTGAGIVVGLAKHVLRLPADSCACGHPSAQF